MKYLYKLSLAALFMLLSLPSQAADELIKGVKNEYVLMSLLGGGVILLFVCILTLAFFLYTMLPTLLRKKFEKEGKSSS